MIQEGRCVRNECNEALRKVLGLAEQLLSVADRGDANRDDVGCGVLFGAMRDCAYKIRSLAKAEIAEHKKRGKWPETAKESKEPVL